MRCTEKGKLESELTGGGERLGDLDWEGDAGTGYPYPRAVWRCGTQGRGVGYTHTNKLQCEPSALRGIAWSTGSVLWGICELKPP